MNQVDAADARGFASPLAGQADEAGSALGFAARLKAVLRRLKEEKLKERIGELLSFSLLSVLLSSF